VQKKIYTLKVYNSDKSEALNFMTRSKRRFRNKLKAFNWKKGMTAYFKVKYGIFEDCWGKRSVFYNDTDTVHGLNNKRDVLGYLNIFDELSVKDFV